MSLLTMGPLPVTAPLVLMYLTSREGLGSLGMTLADLARGFGVESGDKPERGPLEKAMLATIDIEKLLAVERATVEKSR